MNKVIYFALLGSSVLSLWAADSDSGAGVEDQIRQLKARIEAQQQQIESIQAALHQEMNLLEGLERPKSIPPAVPEQQTVMVEPSVAPMPKSAASSLSFSIGQAEFTPSGFLDFTFYRRSTGVGSGIGTAFGDIPFGNTAAGRLSESRLSTQNSRVGLRVDSKVLGWNVLGYLETDFLGSAPSNTAVTSNSNPLRLRLYWVNVDKGKFEMLAGQSWSLMTPNRSGLSALPRDLSYSLDMDTNYQVGLTWARQPSFRVIVHPNSNWTWGVSLEAPEQFAGGAVKFPAALASTYTGEVNTGAAGLSIPNLAPDIISKLAYDNTVGGKAWHVELAGLYRTFRTFNPATNQRFTKPAGGGSFNFDLELAKGLHLIADQFASDGGGRYIFGLGPDLVIRADGGMTLVHSASTLNGLEYQAGPNTLLFGYYGAAWFGRTVAIDANGKPVGFGYTGSAANSNRTIQEPSFGVIQTFWRHPTYGALQLMTQYSYLTRSPWWAAPGTPSNAATHMMYVNLRYTLP